MGGKLHLAETKALMRTNKEIAIVVYDLQGSFKTFNSQTEALIY